MSGDRAQSLRLFQTHNRVQLSRLTALAPHPQPLFFQLLPLILHGNFKLLPGYTSEDCPAGIIDYQPETGSLRAASSVDRNFQYRRKALRRYVLRGVYLLSDFNGLSYPQPARFKLWVVHQAHLSANALQALQVKLTAIKDWAAQLGIHLDCLLVSEADVRLNAGIQSDLADFYVNGLVIAGSLPLWWLVTVQEQADYKKIADRLMTQRQLSQYSLLDFGEPAPASAQDLLDKFLQCWFAAFFSDGRRDLALLFASRQCRLFPQTADLTLFLKQRLENGEIDSSALGRASLQLAALDNAETEATLLAARQSLYLQTQERLSSKVLHPAFAWRRQFITNAVESWQWSVQQLLHLDQPMTLGLRAVLKQPAQRWQWLAEQLRIAQQFARQHSLADDRIKTAGKHLALQQSPPADAVLSLGLTGLPDSGLEQLNLYRRDENTNWQLSDLPAGETPHQPLYAAKALVNVLSFAIINGLLTRNSWLRVNDPQPQLASHHILELSQLLLRSPLARPIAPAANDALQHPAFAQKLILLVNLQPAPLDHLQQQGLQMTSKQNDPLSFSSAQTNLLASIDLLLLSSWGQWHNLQFSGPDAVSDLLATLLRWQPSPAFVSDLLCWCPTAIYGQAISQRLQMLITDLLAFQQNNPQHGRYLLRSGRQLWAIQWQDEQIETQALSQLPAAWREPLSQQTTASRMDPWLAKQLNLNTQQH